tara:strand:+ start:152 stop:316 length:165 start_codon:yes stop_codon:yes gene_type:complete
MKILGKEFYKIKRFEYIKKYILSPKEIDGNLKIFSKVDTSFFTVKLISLLIIIF